MVHTKSFYYNLLVFVQIRESASIQCNQLTKTNATSYTFQKISGLKIFSWSFPRDTENILADHMWPANRYLPTAVFGRTRGPWPANV